MIPTIQPIRVQPRPLNDRLWFLHRKAADRSATSMELIELEALCQALETEQDNDLRTA